MSVQYDQAPPLTYAQQDAVQHEYDARAKNPTTAFLLCYFLGVFGAHRIYLAQWGAAALRLLLPLIAAALAILGLLDVLSFATFALAIIALLCALIWEALDLISLDSEVNAANSALMDRLLATSALTPASASPSSPRRPESLPEPMEGLAQSMPVPDTAPDTAGDAGMTDSDRANASLAASAASNPPAPAAAPEPVVAAPEAEPTPLTFEPEPAPPLALDESALPRENVSPFAASPLPPSASAYVPPVAPEIVNGGFAASAAPAEQPESPPIWPGLDAPTLDAPALDAPTWPGGGAGLQPTAPPHPDPASPSAPAPPDAPQAPGASPPPAPPPLKHIRVRRKIMLDDGTVVGEQVLEDDFPVEMDTQEAAKILEARFQQLSLDEIARQANLPPGTDLQLKRE
jgi:TM2 domain-containing membrane protein YozV